jgi:hypothetical protein
VQRSSPPLYWTGTIAVNASARQSPRHVEIFVNYILIHKRKEIENFLLAPDSIDRALRKRTADRARRSGGSTSYKPFAKIILDSFSQAKKTYVASQYSFRATKIRANSVSALARCFSVRAGTQRI